MLNQVKLKVVLFCWLTVIEIIKSDTLDSKNNETTEKTDNNTKIKLDATHQYNVPKQLQTDHRCTENWFGPDADWQKQIHKKIIKLGLMFTDRLNNEDNLQNNEHMRYFEAVKKVCEEKVVNLFYTLQSTFDTIEESEYCEQSVMCPPMYSEYDNYCVFPHYVNSQVKLNMNAIKNRPQNQDYEDDFDDVSSFSEGPIELKPVPDFHLNRTCIHGQNGMVTLKCNSTGQWEMTTMVYQLSETEYIQDYTYLHDTTCLHPDLESWENDDKFYVSVVITVLVFSTLSLLFLIPAVFIYFYYATLRCTKNYIHANLMISFIFKCIVDISRNQLNHWLFNQYLLHSYNPEDIHVIEGREFPYHIDILSVNSQVVYVQNKGFLAKLSAFSCVFFNLFKKYSQLANHFWLMNEGLYLYNLLNLTRMIGDCTIYIFLVIGWLVPFFIILVHVIITLVHKNDQELESTSAVDYESQKNICWEEITDYENIIRIPIVLTTITNLIIFSVVLKTISSKMKRDSPGRVMVSVRECDPDDNMSHHNDTHEHTPHGRRNTVHNTHTQESNRPYSTAINDPPRNLRLVKSILMLIPLLGVHYTIYTFAYLSHAKAVIAGMTLKKWSIVLDHVLSSLEGFLVAYFFCFCNQEVKSALKRDLFRRSRSITSLHMHTHYNDNRRRSSLVPPYRNSLTPLHTHNPANRFTATTRLDDPRDSNNSASQNSINKEPKDSETRNDSTNLTNTMNSLHRLGTDRERNSAGRVKNDSTSSNPVTGYAINSTRNSNLDYLKDDLKSSQLNHHSSHETATRSDSVWKNFKYRVNLLFKEARMSSTFNGNFNTSSNNYSIGHRDTNNSGNTCDSNKRLLDSLSSHNHNTTQNTESCAYF